MLVECLEKELLGQEQARLLLLVLIKANIVIEIYTPFLKELIRSV